MEAWSVPYLLSWGGRAFVALGLLIWVWTFLWTVWNLTAFAADNPGRAYVAPDGKDNPATLAVVYGAIAVVLGLVLAGVSYALAWVGS